MPTPLFLRALLGLSYFAAHSAAAADAARPLNLTDINRALMLGGHPDDMTQFAGGLAFRLAAQGATIGYATGTYGDASGNCYNFTTLAPTPAEDCTREFIALQREHEMRAARRSSAEHL